MRRLRRVGPAAVAVAAAVVLVAGCGGDDGGGEGEPSPSASRTAVSPRDALADYERATASGCTSAEDCQEFMSRKLAAAVRVRKAMEAKDPALYAVPVGLVEEAERRADHYGRDNLAARGNMLAVSQPLQGMVRWFREHPEG